jgi:hypothetical protein
MPLQQILAQHLFTTFIWSIVGSLPEDCLGQGLPATEQDVEIDWARRFTTDRFFETWTAPKLRHRRLSAVLQRIELTGLGNMTDILLCIIPALSFMDLLPNEAILSLLPTQSPDQGWAETAHCYRNLLKTDMGVSTEEHFCYAAVVASIDFLLFASEPYDDYVMPSPELKNELMAMVAILIRRFGSIVGKLFPVYAMQSRLTVFQQTLDRFGVDFLRLERYDLMSERTKFEIRRHLRIKARSEEAGLSKSELVSQSHLRWSRDALLEFIGEGATEYSLNQQNQMPIAVYLSCVKEVVEYRFNGELDGFPWEVWLEWEVRGSDMGLKQARAALDQLWGNEALEPETGLRRKWKVTQTRRPDDFFLSTKLAFSDGHLFVLDKILRMEPNAESERKEGTRPDVAQAKRLKKPKMEGTPIVVFHISLFVLLLPSHSVLCSLSSLSRFHFLLCLQIPSALSHSYLCGIYYCRCGSN